MKISIEEFKGALQAIKNETQAIEGCSDPRAIRDCWAIVFEFIEQEYSTDKIEPKLATSPQPELPSINELQPFLYWVFHEADKIWVEHTLGWRENAIEEMYKSYLRRNLTRTKH